MEIESDFEVIDPETNADKIEVKGKAAQNNSTFVQHRNSKTGDESGGTQD